MKGDYINLILNSESKTPSDYLRDIVAWNLLARDMAMMIEGNNVGDENVDEKKVMNTLKNLFIFYRLNVSYDPTVGEAEKSKRKSITIELAKDARNLME